MTCPKCETPMNHHADKLVEPTTDAERKYLDPQLGGVVKRTHTCPACGDVEFELAAPPAHP